MTADRVSRTRATQDTDRSMIVEASAGTGKTSTLISRILHLTLTRGPDGPPLSLGAICAITFTEKAAGEMKVRLRYELEQRSALPGPTGERARRVLPDLDAAVISTFHAFAVSLLKERPFEAGLDPHFTALDEIQGEIFFQEVWDEWLRQVVTQRDPIIEKALRMGLTLAALGEVASTLRREAYAVRTLPLPAPPTDEEVAGALRRRLEEGRAYARLALKADDKLLARLHETLHWLEDPASGAASVRSSGNVGSKNAWSGGGDTVTAVRGFVADVIEMQSFRKLLPARRMLCELVRRLIEQFLPEWQARKRRRGLLDFDDQLLIARDLLRSSRAARGEFQKRFRSVLVDEFQDTDPLQLELLLLLTCPDLGETDPSRLRPAPGRLFVVGDPKQSIYRFRGADIETYQEIVGAGRIQYLGFEKVALTTNMRSVPSILDFVDQAFQHAMRPPEDGCYQPPYLAFGGPGMRRQEPAPPSVHLLGELAEDKIPAGSGSDFFRIECSRIAAVIRRMHGSGEWLMQEKRSAGLSGSDVWRRPRYGDIAVLLPVLTRSDILEDSLRGAGIPYVLEGGKFYYARSEVSSAITVLRAVANPNDQVALYGALRSIFFGLSDEDLLAAHIRGLPLDYREAVPADSPLAGPYEVLRGLHAQRHHRSAAESFETLLRSTGAREVLACRGLQSLANLGKLGRTLRSLEGESTFSQVVDLVASLDAEGMAESESRLMEEQGDAVRVMSVHRSKGLDFPIVFAAGLGLRTQARNPAFLADLHGRREFALRARVGESQVATPGWEDLLKGDRNREEAELVRLLYVALTRARDHVVLCTHHKGKMDRGNGRWAADFRSTRLRPLADFLTGGLRSNTVPVRLIDPAALEIPTMGRPEARSLRTGELMARLRRECQELERLISTTPFAGPRRPAARSEDELPPEQRPGDAALAGAVRLGIAFHEAMESVDLATGENLEQCAESSGVRHRLGFEAVRRIQDMMGICLSSPLLGRARGALSSGRQVWRELPFVRPLETGVVEEGKIDLLFEEEAGWVLVDYKTEDVEALTPEVEAVLRSKHSGQMREYVAALSAFGLRVRSACLLMTRTGLAIEMPVESRPERETA